MELYMTIFYVATNGRHTTVVSTDSEDKEYLLKVAIDRFNRAGIDASGLAITKVIDAEESLEDGWGDDPEAIGLSDGVFIEAATSMINDDNLAVDDDAVVSGFNVMAWKWMDPEDVLRYLAKCRPIANDREMPPRDARHDVALDAGRAVVAAFDAFRANADSASLSALAAVMKDLEVALGSKREPKVALSCVIQSWEVAGDQETWSAMSEDQRKPWKVEVEYTSANQLEVTVWPESEEKEDATSGLGLSIEIDRGIPTVHVSPAPYLDNACHIRQVSGHEVRVTPGTRLPGVDVQEGKEPGFVFSNGSPQV